MLNTLCIVGVGLLGGSLGWAAKSRRLAKRVVGVGRDPAKLAQAKAGNILDDWSTDLRSAVAVADVVVFCTPVDQIAEQILSVADAFPPDCLVTDAGSTKRLIVDTVEGRLPKHVKFVGSHPMAGSEKKGADHANPELYQNRVCILTPTGHTHPDTIARATALWEGVGCKVRTLSPIEHDHAVAYISHLPHVVASALAGVVDPALLPFSAGGFRDTTRIAGAGSGIWEPIFRTNRTEVLAACELFATRLEQFQQLLRDDDTAGIIHWLNEGKRVRDALGS